MRRERSMACMRTRKLPEPMWQPSLKQLQALTLCIDFTGEVSREGDNDVQGLGPPSKRQRADLAWRDNDENIDGMAAWEVTPDPAPLKSGQQQPPPEQLALQQRQAQPQKQQTPDREHPLEAQRSPQPCTVLGPPQHGQEPTTQQQYGPPARRQAPGLPDQTAQAGQQVPERRQDHVQAATVQQPEGQPPQEPAPQQQAAAIQPIPTQRTSIQLETQQRQRGVPEPQGQRQQAAEGPLLHTPQRPPLSTVVRGKVEVAR
ncbi:hypothetical protein Vretimale_10191 [Volvox reticuliferus]|uniref:Uncharacterized protein n=1 Tax=Volvox reticuliferus TaxID=1737510 RepID=A0A8J4FFA9_9CHLO|nr:hypothetical protein Vretifemale_503 [Volvox reticuliferus]GIM05815.1 hypothetical protein Vretimale_10191 [Volvox reticuliferus]